MSPSPNKPNQRRPKTRDVDLDIIQDLDDLLDLRMPLPQTSGIYFLFQGDVIVYIGQSIDITRRIIQHRDERKIPFDTFSAIPFNAAHLDFYEGMAIHHHKPRFNTGPGRWPRKDSKWVGTKPEEMSEYFLPMSEYPQTP